MYTRASLSPPLRPPRPVHHHKHGGGNKWHVQDAVHPAGGQDSVHPGGQDAVP